MLKHKEIIMLNKIVKREQIKPLPIILSDDSTAYYNRVVWYVTKSGDVAVLRKNNGIWGFIYLREFLTQVHRTHFNAKFEDKTQKESIENALNANRNIYSSDNMNEFMKQVLECQ